MIGSLSHSHVLVLSLKLALETSCFTATLTQKSQYYLPLLSLLCLKEIHIRRNIDLFIIMA